MNETPNKPVSEHEPGCKAIFICGFDGPICPISHECTCAARKSAHPSHIWEPFRNGTSEFGKENCVRCGTLDTWPQAALPCPKVAQPQEKSANGVCPNRGIKECDIVGCPYHITISPQKPKPPTPSKGWESEFAPMFARVCYVISSSDPFALKIAAIKPVLKAFISSLLETHGRKEYERGKEEGVCCKKHRDLISKEAYQRGLKEGEKNSLQRYMTDKEVGEMDGRESQLKEDIAAIETLDCTDSACSRGQCLTHHFVSKAVFLLEAKLKTNLTK